MKAWELYELINAEVEEGSNHPAATQNKHCTIRYVNGLIFRREATSKDYFVLSHKLTDSFEPLFSF